MHKGHKIRINIVHICFKTAIAYLDFIQIYNWNVRNHECRLSSLWSVNALIHRFIERAPFWKHIILWDQESANNTIKKQPCLDRNECFAVTGLVYSGQYRSVLSLWKQSSSNSSKSKIHLSLPLWPFAHNMVMNSNLLTFVRVTTCPRVSGWPDLNDTAFIRNIQFELNKQHHKNKTKIKWEENRWECVNGII